MNPLVSLAISQLPGLAKRIADKVMPDVEEKVADTVRNFLGTDDPQQADIELQDPKIAAELRVRLAEIEAEADRREAELRQKEREGQLEAIRLQFDQFKTALQDKQDARATMTGLARLNSPLAWGPVIVSAVVTLGFFAVLLYLISAGLDPASQADQALLQIVNIAVGALTAGFATVVSFWLGSSSGSRNKDDIALQTQSQVAAMQRDSLSATERIVDNQSRQARELIQRVAREPVAAAPTLAPKKSTRQFRRCVDIILGHEGGYVDHPSDPGGATNMGITFETLRAWRGESITKADVQELSEDEAREIYRANYWNALNCDQLPIGVDLVTFDFGVNAGVSRAAKMLQRIVAVEADGQIGPITIGAVSQNEAGDLITEFSDARLSYYRSLSHWETFGRGWSRRTAETRDAALDMLRAGGRT
ncbi:MAG: hypothetical protein GVY22_04825 [Gammaproteobacteria bacterium]|jgi:hypothetical protein|nr:hypothetical protein [Gammaproteobacteria bacterium]